ncbi:MAG: hypothetical protein ACR2OH_09215 [Microthrixaceae bacterium]
MVLGCVAIGFVPATVGAVDGAPLDDPPVVDEGDKPGVYIEEETSNQSDAFEAPASVGLFFGSGEPEEAPTPGEPLLITSMSELEEMVDSPSSALRSGLEQYFKRSKSEARVVLATSEDAATLSSSIESVTADVGPALWVVPSLGQLSGAEYQAVAVELSKAAAASAGMALLDPPDAVVDPMAGSKKPDVTPLVGLAGILRTALPAPDHTVLYSAPLVDPQASGDEVRVPAAAVMAAQFTAADNLVGQWQAPAGASYPLVDLDPLYGVDNSVNAALNEAGIDAMRTMTGYGTVVWGARTLGESADGPSYVSSVRTLDLVRLSIRSGLEAFESSVNEKGTWELVDAGATDFLKQLWQEGGLVGSNDEEAYSVEVGVPQSMTAEDVANGYLKLKAEVALEFPAEFAPVDVTVQMQTE